MLKSLRKDAKILARYHKQTSTMDCVGNAIQQNKHGEYVQYRPRYCGWHICAFRIWCLSWRDAISSLVSDLFIGLIKRF